MTTKMLEGASDLCNEQIVDLVNTLSLKNSEND